jgi:hypothetical protein
VAERVVDQLETIEVDEHQTKYVVATPAHPYRGLEHLLKAPTVGQSGEAVVGRQVTGAGLRLLALGDILEYDHPAPIPGRGLRPRDYAPVVEGQDGMFDLRLIGASLKVLGELGDGAVAPSPIGKRPPALPGRRAPARRSKSMPSRWTASMRNDSLLFISRSLLRIRRGDRGTLNAAKPSSTRGGRDRYRQTTVTR